MTVGIVGLGLIGGSFAKALKSFTGHTVYGCDTDASVQNFAVYMNVIDGVLDERTLPECDYVIVSVFPSAAVEWIKRHTEDIKKGAIVVDCCGIKQVVCEKCFPLAKEKGFVFIGGHPMAGYHKSGLKYSRDTLYKGASMILVMPDTENIALLSSVTEFFKALGFSSITVTDARTHDKNIAFTSQLAHVVSNAYVKSPQAKVHKGFSAGSYKDLTRVAYLNEVMWTELFMDNREYLKAEIDHIILELNKYSDALEAGDAEAMQALLKDGKIRKESIDK